MTEGEKAFVFCVRILRWTGFSFAGIRRSPDGDFISDNSVNRLLANAVGIGVFAFFFLKVDLNTYSHIPWIRRVSAFVYPLYTQFIALFVVVFLVCGNASSGKSMQVVNIFRRVIRELEARVGPFPPRKKSRGTQILLSFLLYAILMTCLDLLADAHFSPLEKKLRIVHHVCFFYMSVFAAHFVLVMNVFRENYAFLNAIFQKSVVSLPIRRKIKAWTWGSLELREAEKLANAAFGKQIFLTFVFAFSGIVVNAFYFISLNVHGRKLFWVNFSICTGFLHSVLVTFVCTWAAESAAREANRANEILFWFVSHLNSLDTFTQVHYFSAFAHFYPVKFNTWIFYDISYDSLFKVSKILLFLKTFEPKNKIGFKMILTSSAVTAIILQLDFMEGPTQG